MKAARVIAILSIFMLVSGRGAAQSYQAPKKAEPEQIPAQNAFYVELLGNAGAYSLNYERLILLGPPVSLRGRLGLSFFGSRFAFPAMLQVTHSFLGPLEMEWGGGASLIPDPEKGSLDQEWTALAGLRYSNSNGFLFRVGYTPFFRSENGSMRVKHWGGISVGLLF